MTSAGIDTIDHAVHQANVWIRDLDEVLEWQDRAKSFRVLRAVLQTLRDWLTINEIAHLSAQLPTMIRGTFFDQWRPSPAPLKDRSREAFLERVAEATRAGAPIDPTVAARAVFRVLNGHVTVGQIEDLRDSLPKDLRALWPEPAEPVGR
ncbi:MAG: DUF2267 domain-containing protein [Bauldia sp.]|nr:DUF2267 domain-containing protein [Bauldia sp.]